MTLFDDAAPDDGPRVDPSHTWSVPELHGWLDAAVTAAMPTSIWVEGEITNLSRSSAGHVYFTLAAPGETGRNDGHGLSVALFKWQRDQVNLQLRRGAGAVRMTDGTRVRIRGDISLYGPRMQVQLKMFAIDPAFTLGDLALRRTRLLEALTTEGLLDANRSIAVAPLPLRVGLVTSIGSAAHADFLHELESSAIGFRVLCADARVQGVDSAATITAAILRLAVRRVDVIAVVRGGGAQTDLASFDDEVVARAIATAPVPVWVGIGHETDTTVADMVANRSWKTPTACAAGVVAAVRVAGAAAEQRWDAVLSAAADGLRGHQARHDRRTRLIARACLSDLDRAAEELRHQVRRVAVVPERLGAARVELDRTTARLGPPTLRQIDDASRRLDLVAARVHAEDPRRLLERGWSITRLADGTILRTPVDAPPGTHLSTTLVDGAVHSTVTHTEDRHDHR